GSGERGETIEIMKTSKPIIRLSVFKGELWSVTVWKDFKMFFSKGGWATIRKERLHLHAGYTALINAGTIILALIIDIWCDVQVARMPVWGFAVLGGLEGFAVNGIRVAMKQKNGGKDSLGKWYVPFSWLDVRAGTYTGIVVNAVLGVLIHLIF